ncbi:hypothetical protein DPMN_160011 [Dreissena polymorpha]|uniref:Uncharacterized protein n=1 Tax=Dreissena polymorpha TaxID=45954 RepID=A0A9D4EQA2_DREPO|nr:hypothetical protein DPMN_160011 [Dreissena polymorpha]
MHKSTGAYSSTDGLQRCVAYLFATCAHRLIKRRRMRNVQKMRHGVMDAITEEEKLLAVDALKTHILQAQTVNKI